MQDITIISEIIKSKIYTIRRKQVMLDSDLARLYDIETKRLKEQVKRNLKRFPSDFMFQLDENEVNAMGSQIATPSKQQFGGYLPYAFTEQGVAMLSSVLRSQKAIDVNIQIIRAFIEMRKYISKNLELFTRIGNVEKKQIEYDKNFEQIFNALEDKTLPTKGIFFEGQVFDAYKFVSELIKSAKESIILIDNYVDESILTLFEKRNENVKVVIYSELTKQLELDLKKFNSQYEQIEIKQFNKSHDRFLIIDNKVYHFGASLKDLGKKWFAFSKMDKGFKETIVSRTGDWGAGSEATEIFSEISSKHFLRHFLVKLNMQVIEQDLEKYFPYDNFNEVMNFIFLLALLLCW